MERAFKFLNDHKRKIIFLGASIIGIGIGINLYYHYKEGEEEFIVYTEGRAIQKLFPEFKKINYKKCENSKDYLKYIMITMYSTSLLYIIFKLQISIINEQIFFKEHELNYKQQEEFITSFYKNIFLKDIYSKIVSKINEISEKELKQDCKMTKENFKYYFLKIRDSFEEEFEINLEKDLKNELLNILKDSIMNNLETFYSVYKECIEGMFQLFLNQNEENFEKNFELELEYMYYSLETNKYISYIDHTHQLNLFCLKLMN